MKFSVLMSVYKNERPEYFSHAMDSVLGQTLLPDEIVLMRDGPVPDGLQRQIDRYLNGKYKNIISYYPLECNEGLGNALRFGVQKAKNDYVARMDTDDIAAPDRFEKQVGFLDLHPQISVCGGQIIEFADKTERIVGKREVPLNHEEIVTFMAKRNAFNHMTVMFKKQDVIDSGNYKELRFVEDYYLWCRMLTRGYRFANLPDVLVYARTDEKMYRRRGGYRYFQQWKRIEKFKLDHQISNRRNYCETLVMRFVVQVLMPNRARGWILKTFSRK